MKMTMAAVGVVLLLSPGVTSAGDAFGGDPEQDARAAVELSRGHVSALASRHGVAENDLVSKRVKIDSLLMAHNRLQQHHQGVPVWGGEAIVHLRRDGELARVTDNLVSSVRLLDTRPTLSASDAITRAVARLGCSDCLTAAPVADLWVKRYGTRDRLVYRVRLQRLDGTEFTSMPVYFVDAVGGAVLSGYDNLQTGTGKSLYSGNVTFGSTFAPDFSAYALEDMVRNLGTFDAKKTTNQFYYLLDVDNVWTTPTNIKAALDAHHGAAKTFDYFQSRFGRNGIDGAGGPAGFGAASNNAVGLMSSIVHYGVKYNNAFWNGTFMVYGDGDGETFKPLVTLDIAGHEMTHGITENLAGLIYERESGALNESMSDVFGAMVERFADGNVTSPNTWKIGEDAYTPSTPDDALRYMDQPKKGGDPDHLSEALVLGDAFCDNTNDQCGVHINSGIANNAFYVLAQGTSDLPGDVHSNGGAMTGIGPDAAAAIWYRALDTYMTTNTTFLGARTATLSAATDLHGNPSTQYTAVGDAWCLVGVGTSCPTPGGPNFVVNPSFESGNSPWTIPGQISLATGTGSDGTRFLESPAVNKLAVNNRVMSPKIVFPLGATGSLSIHTYITTQETNTLKAYDKLTIEILDANGKVIGKAGTFSNLQSSAGWVRKTMNVTKYRGKTIRLAFKFTTDSSLPTIFRVDNILLQ